MDFKVFVNFDIIQKKMLKYSLFVVIILLMMAYVVQNAVLYSPLPTVDTITERGSKYRVSQSVIYNNKKNQFSICFLYFKRPLEIHYLQIQIID